MTSSKPTNPHDFRPGDRANITFTSGDWARPTVESPAELELDGATIRLVTNTGTLRWHPHGAISFFWRPSPTGDGRLDIADVRSVEREEQGAERPIMRTIEDAIEASKHVGQPVELRWSPELASCLRSHPGTEDVELVNGDRLIVSGDSSGESAWCVVLTGCPVEREPVSRGWRELTEQTGYRVLTLPDGSTISAADIRRVILHRETETLGKIFPAHVTIVMGDGTGRDVYEDVDAVLEVAAEAHRRWGGRSSTGEVTRIEAGIMRGSSIGDHERTAVNYGFRGASESIAWHSGRPLDLHEPSKGEGPARIEAAPDWWTPAGEARYAGRYTEGEGCRPLPVRPMTSPNRQPASETREAGPCGCLAPCDVVQALAVISRFGGIDGGHHKQWVLDQVVRALTGPGYEAWVREQKAGEDGPETYSWDVGVAP